MDHTEDSASFERSHQHVLNLWSSHEHGTLPAISILQQNASELISSLPNDGCGISETTNHLLHTVAPALNGSSLSANYYGFVTGGVTPAARIADSIVSAYDQNVSVHLPDQSISTIVEDKALCLLFDLLRLDASTWSGRTFSTGATASNILGLLCGREYIVNEAVKRRSTSAKLESVGDDGLLGACRAADIDCIQVLSTMPHSSLLKASSVVGFGRSCVIDVGVSEESLEFNFAVLEDRLKRQNTVSIVALSCGEVNTGLFATHSYSEVECIRALCDKYGAWIHVDGAFGLLARMLEDGPEFGRIRSGADGLELADSITGDAHKLLNVPYDCGFFFCRHKDLSQQVLHNPNAAYLNFNVSGAAKVASPLNVGIENSRRFRGLPVYITLMAYGRRGYRDMLIRQIRFARLAAAFIHDHPALELLPKQLARGDSIGKDIFVVVLFRAKNPKLNAELVGRINASTRIYVSGTVWRDEPASRIAVSNWQVDPKRDMEILREVIEGVIND